MSRDDLREMFADLAEDVTGAQLARAAVAGAARIRRRRRVVAGASVVVLASTLAAVAWWSPDGTPPALNGTTPTATARPSGAVRIDRIPDTVRTEADAGPYWPASLDPPRDAPALTAAPLSHASLLVMPFTDGPPRVYVYGEGMVNGGSGDGTFRWARLDVDLTRSRSDGAGTGWPVDHNSLGPMGQRAAFAQPDAVVVVDIQTGRVDRIPAPGANHAVTWLPDGDHVLVSSTGQTWLINVETRSRVRAAAPAHAVTPLVGGATGLTALTGGMGDGPPDLRRYDDAGLAERGSHVVDDEPARPHSVVILLGRGWRYGNLIAQAAAAQPGNDVEDVVVVIDDRTDAVTHALAMGGKQRFDRGCCTAVGWAGAGGDVLVADVEGLLRWRLATGEVARLSDPVRGIVSVAPMGCDWTITVNHVTASCTT